MNVPAALELLRGGPLCEPFAPARVERLARLSRALLDDPQARAFPELVALASALRPAELRRLEEGFQALSTPDTLLVPRGGVLHLPPSNVDTVAVLAWSLSYLCGNRDLVRRSSREGPAGRALHEVLGRVLADEPAALFATSAHDEELLARLSRAADLRLLWGSDPTVARLRALPLAPQGHELLFGDRWSLSVLRAEAVLTLDAAGREELAQALYRDLQPFAQQACSSPRLLLWIGPGAEPAQAALVPELRRVWAARGGLLEPAERAEGRHRAFSAALTLPVAEVQPLHPSLWLLRLLQLDALPREVSAPGLLPSAALPTLDALIPLLGRRDQTLGCFGFAAEELRAFARRAGAACPDRLVPVGQALRFGRYWDGHDLLQAFTRRIHLPR